MACTHEKVICACCGKEGTPAQFLREGKGGARSPAGAEQSRKAAKKSAEKRKLQMTLQQAAELLSGDQGTGEITYREFHYRWEGLGSAPFARNAEVRPDLTSVYGGGVAGAKKFLRESLKVVQQNHSRRK